MHVVSLTFDEIIRRHWLLNIREVVQCVAVWVRVEKNLEGVLKMWISSSQIDSMRGNLGYLEPIIDYVLNLRIAGTGAAYGISGIFDPFEKDVCRICRYARDYLTGTQGEEDNEQIHSISNDVGRENEVVARWGSAQPINTSLPWLQT